MKIPLFALALICCLAAGCASPRHGENNSSPDLRADHIITTADDFVVDVYLNGERVADDRRELLAEIYGATVERINLRVHRGDWLVFHVVNDRMRWNGAYYFAAAGVLGDNEYGFVSKTRSGDWSVCDKPSEITRFVQDKYFLQNNPAQPIQNAWGDGAAQMAQYAGPHWSGQPIWGNSPDTWLKVIVR
jgi:hypothetical protein